MTEREWLACADPMPMLEFLRSKARKRKLRPWDRPDSEGELSECLRGKARRRKLRLFSIACVLPLLHRISHEPGLEAIEVSERFADGLASEADLEIACERLDKRNWETGWVTADDAARAIDGACYLPSRGLNSPCDLAGYTASWAIAAGEPDLDWTQSDEQARDQHEKERDRHEREETFHQCVLLRDVFGVLPFRSVVLNPSGSRRLCPTSPQPPTRSAHCLRANSTPLAWPCLPTPWKKWAASTPTF